MTDENKNNSNINPRPLVRPNGSFSRPMNYRQTPRPMSRNSYLNEVMPITPAKPKPVQISQPNQNVQQQASSQIFTKPLVQNYQPNALVQPSTPLNNNPVASDSMSPPVSNLRHSKDQEISRDQVLEQEILAPKDQVVLDEDIDRLFPVIDDQVTPHRIPTNFVPKTYRLPPGIYMIFIFNVASFITSWFIGTSLSFLFSVVILANLVMSVMLVMKSDNAVNRTIKTSIATIIIGILFILIFFLDYTITNNQFMNNYNTIKSPVAAKMTIEQKKSLAESQAKIISRKYNLSNAQAIFYIYTTLVIVESSAVIYYLHLPAVEDYFIKKTNPLNSSSTI